MTLHIGLCKGKRKILLSPPFYPPEPQILPLMRHQSDLLDAPMPAATTLPPPKVSLARLLPRPSVTAPIASATNLDQLTDLIDATNLKLDKDAIELLNQTGP